MTRWWRFTALGVLTAGMMLACGTGPGMAQSRAHVYLLRGLLNIFSLGMDTLGDELNRRGVYATVDNHANWQELADQAAAKYKAGREGPIILIGHSLGANAVMEMAAYLGKKGVPVALVVPFDGTDSYPASANVARVLNLTKHYYMSRGPGFHGSLLNVDLRNDSNIDHLNIDKSPRLHARVIAEILALVGERRTTVPTVATPGALKPTAVSATAPGGTPGGATAAPANVDGVAPAPATSATTGTGAMNATDAAKPLADSGTPIIALPEKNSAHAGAPAQ